MEDLKQTVVVLGASPKPERYSNKAVSLLKTHGHKVIPVHPAIKEIVGLPVAASLAEIDRSVDTLTLYVSSVHSTPLIDTIISLNPARVIFNPGTENPVLRSALKEQDIHAEDACTLVLLNTGQF